MRIPGKNVSLVIYFIANFSFLCILYERYFIDRSKTLRFVLIPGIVCQLSDINYGQPLQNVTYQKVHFHLKTRQSFENHVDVYQLILKVIKWL